MTAPAARCTRACPCSHGPSCQSLLSHSWQARLRELGGTAGGLSALWGHLRAVLLLGQLKFEEGDSSGTVISTSSAAEVRRMFGFT
jgi:hypothetical protein